MRKVLYLAILACCSHMAVAEQLANVDLIKPLKEFKLPNLITPNVALGYFPENQYDHTDRSEYFFVTKNIDQAMSPLKINSGVYGRNFYNAVSVQTRLSQFYIMANLNHTKANAYKDGDGQDVGWGYRRFNQALILGFLPSSHQEYRFTYLHDKIEDDKQPHFLNDALETDRHIARFNMRFGKADLSNTLQANLGYTTLKRHANNYQLRAPGSQQVFVDLNRKMYDFSLKHDYDFGQWHHLFGVSYRYDEHNGERYLHTSMRDMLNAYRFGDIHSSRYRIFNTLTYQFNDYHKLALGLSYERLDSEVRKNLTQALGPMSPLGRMTFASPQQIWQAYYGKTFKGKIRQESFSGELKYDFTPSAQQKYSLQLGHIERIGSNIERFNSLAAIVNTPLGISVNNRPTMAIVGNPWLKPEAHNFIKLSVDLKNEAYQGYLNSLAEPGWNVGAHLMFDYVKNLIVYDNARGQQGVAATQGGVVVRNVDANLFVGNLYAHYNFNPNWATKFKAFYHYGQNTQDGRPLYQIRPFELNLQLDYKNYFSHGSYNVGAAVRFVGKQTRGDFSTATGFGIDRYQAAKSFTVVDVYAGINVKDKYGIRLGVNNLFNKKYAEFISGDHVMAVAPTKIINAPGRTYWLSLHAAF